MNIEENKIKLVFNKTITRLAGYLYGRQVYDEQAKGHFSFDKPIIIVFPDHIIRVASSFAQGFFEEIILFTGTRGIGKTVIIETIHPEVKESIIANLLK